MPQFLVRFSYVSSAIQTLVRQPDVDRAAEATAMVASLGARLLGYWHVLGGTEGVVLLEAPDNNVVESIALAIAGSGDVSKFEATALLTMEEVQTAAVAAASARHLPPRSGAHT